MSIERIYYCEGPECNGHNPDGGAAPPPCNASTAAPPPYLPMGIIETRERTDRGDALHHFCCWDCLMKFAAQFPAPEIIPLDGPTP